MTIDDFDIIVSTIPESDRLDRLFQYFYDAGIVRWMLDYEPKYTEQPPIKIRYPGAYGCGQHFCEIQAKMPHRNLIYFEDDAILMPDFCETMNRHLADLPDDWAIFLAGYARVWEHPEDVEGANKVSELIRHNVKIVHGTQCVVLRAGKWRENLTNDMRNHSFYGCKPKHGFDTCLVPWAKENEVPVYCAAQSFVGQGDTWSAITGKKQSRVGI